MPRAITGRIHKHRATALLKKAKGYRGGRSKLFRPAKNAVMKALKYAYFGRKQKKRNFRKLWIARINAVCRENEITYSKFMNGLMKLNITINRKTLSNLAIVEPAAFKELVEKVKSAK
jgi:large subunit ribosomal protein L20